MFVNVQISMSWLHLLVLLGFICSKYQYTIFPYSVIFIEEIRLEQHLFAQDMFLQFFNYWSTHVLDLHLWLLHYFFPSSYPDICIQNVAWELFGSCVFQYCVLHNLVNNVLSKYMQHDLQPHLSSQSDCELACLFHTSTVTITQEDRHILNRCQKSYLWRNTHRFSSTS